MKVFYTLNYTTADYDDDGRIIGYFPSFMSVHPNLYEAYLTYIDYCTDDPDFGYSIRRYVETYILNTKTDTWEVVTEERPLVLYPTVDRMPPVNLTWY